MKLYFNDKNFRFMNKYTMFLCAMLITLIFIIGFKNYSEMKLSDKECMILIKEIEKTNKQYILNHQYSERWWKKYREILRSDWNELDCDLIYSWPNSY